jgi:hypothetical protein
MYSIEYVVPAAGGKKAADMTPIIERYDKRMASTVLADFILLGQQAVGSLRCRPTRRCSSAWRSGPGCR